MDVIVIPWYASNLYGLWYLNVSRLWKGDLSSLSSKEKKEVREKITNLTESEYQIPDEVSGYLAGIGSDDDFLAQVRSWAYALETGQAAVDEAWEEAADCFSEELQEYFAELRGEYDNSFGRVLPDGSLSIRLERREALDKWLTFRGSCGMTPGTGEVGFVNATLSREGDGFVLQCFFRPEGEPLFRPLRIEFRDAGLDRVMYAVPVDDPVIQLPPWQSLAFHAEEILTREEAGKDSFSEGERAILPLLRELASLGKENAFYPAEGYPELAERAERYGMGAAFSPPSGSASPHALIQRRARLLLDLNKVRFEGLWREIREEIRQSQGSYPQRFPTGRKDLTAARKKIEAKLRSLGYEGSWPEFRKEGPVRGFRLVQGWGQSYFVGMEQRGEFIVRCFEVGGVSWEPDSRMICFACGTAFLRRGEERVEDIHSCGFVDGGRRALKFFLYDPEQMDGDAGAYAEVAAKKAECRRLNKSDKRIRWETAGRGPMSPLEAILFAVFTGGMFSVLFMGIAFLVMCIVTLALFGPGEIGGMIRAIPWGLLFLICFVGFGGLMTLVEILSRNK